MTMPNTTLISTFIKTRLEQQNFPSEEFDWAVMDISLIADLDMVSAKDPLYPTIVIERSYVSFYGDLKSEALVLWMKSSCIFRTNDLELLNESLEGGTVFSLTPNNEVPSVLAHRRAGASNYEKTIIDTLVKYLTGKYHALRSQLAEDIKLIYEAGLHLRQFNDDEQLRYAVDDIIAALDKQKRLSA